MKQRYKPAIAMLFALAVIGFSGCSRHDRDFGRDHFDERRDHPDERPCDRDRDPHCDDRPH